jgi:type III restriction enzyme
MRPKKSIFNRIVGDSALELNFARFLDACDDIISFAKNAQNTGFSIEYRTADGSISNYTPDFIVKRGENEIWIVETKGREDLNDPPKIERLNLWCADATASGDVSYRAMYVQEEEWEGLTLRGFDEAASIFAVRSENVLAEIEEFRKTMPRIPIEEMLAARHEGHEY